MIILKALSGRKGTVRNKKYDSICITLCPVSGWAASRNPFQSKFLVDAVFHHVIELLHGFYGSMDSTQARGQRFLLHSVFIFRSI